MAGALSGLKVIELGEMVSAPYAAKLMADMGAEVIKIERPGAGDHARLRGPFPGGTEHPEKSGLYLYLNTNKLGLTLDVSRPEGFALLERLAADADVLIHNVAPSDMDRIGRRDVVNQNVGVGGEALEQREALGTRHVERQAKLVGIEVEIEAAFFRMLRAARKGAAQARMVAGARPFDLD